MKNLNLRAFFNTRKFLAVMAIVTTVAVIPNTASARSSIHIDLPSISLSLHDRHGYRNNRRGIRHNFHNNYHSYRNSRQYKRNNYRSHRGNYRNHYTNNNYYTNGYSYRGFGFQPRSQYNQPSYRGPICPTPGFSTGYDENRGCYAHKDHFHCDS